MVAIGCALVGTSWLAISAACRRDAPSAFPRCSTGSFSSPLNATVAKPWVPKAVTVTVVVVYRTMATYALCFSRKPNQLQAELELPIFFSSAYSLPIAMQHTAPHLSPTDDDVSRHRQPDAARRRYGLSTPGGRFRRRGSLPRAPCDH